MEAIRHAIPPVGKSLNAEGLPRNSRSQSEATNVLLSWNDPGLVRKAPIFEMIEENAAFN